MRQNSLVKKPDQKERRALIVGLGIMGGIAFLLLSLRMMAYLPGPFGKTFSFFAHIFGTPLLMEPALFTVGLLSILILNHRRLKKEGPECVYLETVESPEAAELDPASRSVIYEDKSQPPSGDEMAATIEGFLELEDYPEAVRQLLLVPTEIKDSERFLGIRLRLALHNDDPNQVRGVAKALREIDPEHVLLKQIPNLGLRA